LPYRENSVDPSAGNGRIDGIDQVAFLGPAVAAGVAARGEAVRRGQRFAVEQYADRSRFSRKGVTDSIS